MPATYSKWYFKNGSLIYHSRFFYANFANYTYSTSQRQTIVVPFRIESSRALVFREPFFYAWLLMNTARTKNVIAIEAPTPMIKIILLPVIHTDLEMIESK